MDDAAPATVIAKKEPDKEEHKHGADAELDHAYLTMLSMMSMFPDRVLSIRVGSVSITIE